MLEEIKQETLERMEKSISSLESSLQKIRTGRANPSLLDAIQIDYYGNMTPLSQVSNISVQDAKTLLISPWEKNLVLSFFPKEKLTMFLHLAQKCYLLGKVASYSHNNQFVWRLAEKD